MAHNMQPHISRAASLAAASRAATFCCSVDTVQIRPQRQGVASSLPWTVSDCRIIHVRGIAQHIALRATTHLPTEARLPHQDAVELDCLCAARLHRACE